MGTSNRSDFVILDAGYGVLPWQVVGGPQFLVVARFKTEEDAKQWVDILNARIPEPKTVTKLTVDCRDREWVWHNSIGKAYPYRYNPVLGHWQWFEDGEWHSSTWAAPETYDPNLPYTEVPKKDDVSLWNYIQNRQISLPVTVPRLYPEHKDYEWSNGTGSRYRWNYNHSCWEYNNPNGHKVYGDNWLQYASTVDGIVPASHVVDTFTRDKRREPRVVSGLDNADKNAVWRRDKTGSHYRWNADSQVWQFQLQHKDKPALCVWTDYRFDDDLHADSYVSHRNLFTEVLDAATS